VDPFQEVAKEIAEGTLVLAIDELHVTDQPDAMLLER
jgi:predicted ATPase